MTTFRERLIATLQAAKPLFEVDGVLVAGSEVPNLLEDDAAATLVVSHDVDIAVPIRAHGQVKSRLSRLHGFSASPEEPSVWLPDAPGRIELNFIGYDPEDPDPRSVRIFPDETLPLHVFGPLSFLRVGRRIDVGDGLLVPVPTNAGLLLEKLVTERSGEKGDRDLLVALGLVLVAKPEDLDELVTRFGSLPPDLQQAIRSNLTMLSLLEAVPGMPDPTTRRDVVAAILSRLGAEP